MLSLYRKSGQDRPDFEARLLVGAPQSYPAARACGRDALPGHDPILGTAARGAGTATMASQRSHRYSRVYLLIQGRQGCGRSSRAPRVRSALGCPQAGQGLVVSM